MTSLEEARAQRAPRSTGRRTARRSRACCRAGQDVWSRAVRHAPSSSGFHDYDLAELRALHRLAAVLQRLGDARASSPTSSTTRRPARPPASCATTPRRCSTGIDRGEVADAPTASSGFFPANRVGGDDIEVYTDETAPRCSRPCTTCASRASTATGVPQPVARRLRRAQGDRARRLRRRLRGHRRARRAGEDPEFKADLDDYSAILLESLADRLAEAFAERLHERVRKRAVGLRARRAARQRWA